jgi:hypothetical protein
MTVHDTGNRARERNAAREIQYLSGAIQCSRMILIVRMVASIAQPIRVFELRFSCASDREFYQCPFMPEARREDLSEGLVCLSISLFMYPVM